MAGRILLTFCFRIRLQSWGFNTKLPTVPHTGLISDPSSLYNNLFLNIPTSKSMGWPLKQAAIHNRQAQLNPSVEKGRLYPYTTYIWVLSHITNNLCFLKGKNRKKHQHVARDQKCNCTVFQTPATLLKTSETTCDVFSSMFISTKQLYKQY